LYKHFFYLCNIFFINFRIIGICMAIAIVIAANEMSQSRRIIEILRLVITSLVYLEFIDGRYWISWIILLTTPLCIWYHPIETQKRTLGIMLGFFCPLTLLSSSFEPLFFMALTMNLICWLQVTSRVQESKRSQET